MKDPRIDRLAEILIDHSCRLEKGENILIEAIDLPDPALVCRLVELASERGGRPFVTWKNNAVLRSLYRAGVEEAMELSGEFESARMAKMNAYIGIRGAANSSQFADVPQSNMELYQKKWWQPVHSAIRCSTVDYAITGKTSANLGEGASLSEAQFKFDPWAPVWSSAAFMGVMVFASCLYIYRQDY